MTRVLRAMAAAVLAIGGVVGAASAASAEVLPDGCEDGGDGYFGGGVCQTLIEAAPVCEGGVPYLDYHAVLEGSDASTVTVSWHNPAGPGEVLEGLPLEGRLVWPGTVLDDDGAATDYPGWTRQDDGTWTRGDAFSWAAGTVDVTFTASPGASVSVAYPDGLGACAPVNPTSAGGGGAEASATTAGGGAQVAALSDTGVSAAPLLGAAGGLLLAGALLMVVSRLRRPHGEDG